MQCPECLKDFLSKGDARKCSVSEVVSDIKSGLSDADIANKLKTLESTVNLIRLLYEGKSNEEIIVTHPGVFVDGLNHIRSQLKEVG